MSTTASPPSLTVALRLDGRRCVVVGGGHVGQRRALQMRRCGGDVVVISPTLWPESGRDQLGSAGVEWVAREYRAGDLEGAFVVVAATGRSDVDGDVLADARSVGALTNHVSDATAGDLALVATTETDHVQVSVSTDGRTPALTRWIRDRLAEEIADGYPVLVELFAATRAELRAAGRPTSHPGWDAALKAGLLELVRSGDVDGARRELRRHLGLDS